MQKMIHFILSFALMFFLSCNEDQTVAPVEEKEEEIEQNDGDREWQLVWYDEFDSDKLDSEKWSYQLGTGTEFGLVGWGNNELQYYTDREDNIFLEDGMLHIVARQEKYESMNYTSARIRTYQKGD